MIRFHCSIREDHKNKYNSRKMCHSPAMISVYRCPKVITVLWLFSWLNQKHYLIVDENILHFKTPFLPKRITCHCHIFSSLLFWHWRKSMTRYGHACLNTFKHISLEQKTEKSCNSSSPCFFLPSFYQKEEKKTFCLLLIFFVFQNVSFLSWKNYQKCLSYNI